MLLLLQISDSGLNSLQKNAARVLFRLNEVTNDSQQINSVSNLKASVQVLAILSVKGNLQTNDRTADVSNNCVFHVIMTFLKFLHYSGAAV